MKKFIASFALAGALIMPVGCASPNPVLAPPVATAPAPGYFNAADQTMGQTLAGIHAFYTRIQGDYLAGKVTLTPAEKTAFNALYVSLSVAQPTYIAYHNGQATQAQAQAAIDAASTKQAAVQAMGVN